MAAATMSYRSMLPTIKCSNCGTEIDISMVGEHVCTANDEPEPTSFEPVPAAPAPMSALHAPTKHSSPLQQEITQDDDMRSRSPSPLFDHTTQPIKPTVIPTSSLIHNNAALLAETNITGADSNDRAVSPISPEEATSSTSYLEAPRAARPRPQPSQPSQSPAASIPQDPRPTSIDFFSEQAPTERNLSNEVPTFARPRSPPKLPPHPAKPLGGTIPPLQVKIPTQAERNRRSPSGSSLLEVTSAHSKSSGGSTPVERNRRPGSTGGEDKKILGLFRRKSSRSISKKNITSPILDLSEKVPDVPGVPVALLNPGGSPQSPGVSNEGKRLPTGPAPPRPARPDENMTEIMNQIQANKRPPPPKLPEQPSKVEEKPPQRDPSLPNVHPLERPTNTEQQQPTTLEASAFPGGKEETLEHPSPDPLGLPQISEEGSSPESPIERHPPPPSSAGDRGMYTHWSSHAPSESTSSATSSKGSRYGFDDRSISSISTPATSTASSFQFKDSQEDTKSVPSMMSEASGASLRIPPSPRTANFSRPRGPTIGSPGLAPSPTSTASPSVGGESPREPVTPGEGTFGEPAPLHTAPATLQPTLQPVSYQRPSPQSKPALQPFVRPPLPPMPEEPQQRPPHPLSQMQRPNLSRSKSTASRGDCRGCKKEITGRSIKAADGRLTGRWHRECFVCKTCREPFPSGDFYVHRNEPYCSHHYHVLNNSLCRYCHTGIEGRYFEIDGRRRFHTGCFACAECRRPLAGDYFEMGNKFYCEVDAQRFHTKATHLNPGRRFPERRTTKLMMM